MSINAADNVFNWIMNAPLVNKFEVL